MWSCTRYKLYDNTVREFGCVLRAQFFVQRAKFANARTGPGSILDLVIRYAALHTCLPVRILGLPVQLLI
jgi:hypothetical protein